MAKNTGKVTEFCQSRRVGTLSMPCDSNFYQNFELEITLV